MTELVGTAALFTTRGQHAFFDIRRSLGGAVVRSRRAVLETVNSGLVEAVDPAVRALTGHTHRLGDVSDGMPCLDAFDEQSPTMRRESSVTVRHEDLQVCEAANSTMPGGLHASVDVTNVSAKYS